MIGRKQPYTETGISRVPCYRCGNPSTQQWQICCLRSYYVGVCNKCDIALNELVLKFMGISNRKEIIKRYKKQTGPN